MFAFIRLPKWDGADSGSGRAKMKLEATMHAQKSELTISRTASKALWRRHGAGLSPISPETILVASSSPAHLLIGCSDKSSLGYETFDPRGI